MAPNTKSDDIPLINGNGVEVEKIKRKEILIDNFYYDVTDWVKIHPGGRIIDFYTESGEDATIAFQQFHYRASRKVEGILKSFKRRSANHIEIGLDKKTLARHEALTRDFVELYRTFESEGLFKPSYFHVVSRIMEAIVMLGVGLILMNKSSFVTNCVGTLFFSVGCGRCAFLMHEGGHRALTGNMKLDKFLHMFLLGFGVGMSSSWWSTHHNKHHAMPQRMQRDVDLDTLPLLAFNSKICEEKKWKKGGNIFLRHQGVLFLTLDSLLIQFFWRFLLHPRYAFLKRKYWEIFLMASHQLFLLYNLTFWSHLFGVWGLATYMFGTFSLSHTHLPVTSKSLHWVEYGLVHTMDVNPSWWCDWWMGHLNYQIEHHLFPSIPHFRLHRIRDRVKGLAEKYGIPYQCVSYGQAAKMTYNNLISVSKELQH